MKVSKEKSPAGRSLQLKTQRMKRSHNCLSRRKVKNEKIIQFLKETMIEEQDFQNRASLKKLKSYLEAKGAPRDASKMTEKEKL